MQQRPVEDVALELTGTLLAATYPYSKSKKERDKWFQAWFRLLKKEVLKRIRKRR